jgi:AsmA protein
MKRWIKALLFLLGGVLLLVVAAVVAAILLFDGERIRSVLVETVAEKTGRTLAISDVPELAFWPSLGVRLGAVTLSEKLSADEFAGIDGASLSVAVMPLFRGELVVDSVSVSGLRVRLVRSEDGRLNVADLMGAPSAAAAPAPQPTGPSGDGASPPIRFDVGGIRIEGRELSWLNRQAKQAITVRDFALSTGRLGSGAEGTLGLDATIRLVADGAGGDELRIRLAAPYRMGEKAIELTGLAGDVNGAAAGIRQLRLNIAASGLTVASDGKTADGREFRIEFSGELAGMATAATIGIDEFSWRGAEAGGILASPKSSLAVQASRGAGWKADLALAGVLELRAEAGVTRVKLQDWQGGAEFFDAALLQKSLKLQSTVSADLDLSGPRGEVDLAFAFDDAKSRLRMTLNALSPLDVVAEAQLGKLDLDAYLLAPPPAATPAPGGAEGRPSVDPPVDLSPLAGKRVRARVESAGLKARGLVIDKALVEARLANGRLDLSPLQVALYGGSLDGAVGAAVAGNVVNAKIRLAGVDLNPMLRDLASTELLAGRADVAADLASRGATVGAMKRALAGELRLAVRDGAIKGVNLGRSFRELKARFSQGGSSEVAAQSDAQTDFSELTASFQIRDGVLRGDDLAAKSPFLRLGGAGEVSLPDETLDYLLKATVVNTSSGQGGDELDHLKGLTVPVRLRGPLAAPAWKIEFGGLAGEAAKARVASKKEEVKAKLEANKSELREEVREKARDKLKNLLGR